MTEHEETDQKRRNVLKALAAAGIGGAGLAGASGSGAAQEKGGQGGGGFRRLTFDVTKSGTIEDANAAPAGFENGPAEFDGELVFTDLNVNEDGELVASGRLKGTLEQNPTQQINQTFEDTVLGLLEEILGILQPGDAGECPILTLDVGEIFLDLLGLQIETSTIEIDITAVAGPGNLLGNLLCAVAGLLDP